MARKAQTHLGKVVTQENKKRESGYTIYNTEQMSAEESAGSTNASRRLLEGDSQPGSES